MLPGLQEMAAGASFGTPAEGSFNVQNDGALTERNSAGGAGNDAPEAGPDVDEPPDTGGEGGVSLSPGNSSLVGSLLSLQLAEAPRIKVYIIQGEVCDLLPDMSGEPMRSSTLTLFHF